MNAAGPSLLTSKITGPAQPQDDQVKRLVTAAKNIEKWQGILQPDVEQMTVRSVECRSISAELEAQVEELNGSVDAMSEQVGEFSIAVVDQVQKLSSQVDHLQSRLQSTVEENQRLKSQVARLQSMVEAMMAKNGMDIEDY